jgi:hypothetical protein
MSFTTYKTRCCQCETPQKRQQSLMFGISFYRTGTRTNTYPSLVQKRGDKILVKNSTYLLEQFLLGHHSVSYNASQNWLQACCLLTVWQRSEELKN